MKQVQRRNFDATRKNILNVAFQEVFKKGFQGVSVDDIVKKTSLTKGAFYHHFPTKLDLGYALVDDVIAPMIMERWIVPLSNFENPLKGILALLKQHIGGGKTEYLKFGCPLNNLVQEMAPIDKTFKAKLQAALKLWMRETEKHLRRAQKSGFIKKDVHTRRLAQFIVMAHEGFYGMLKGMDQPGLFNTLHSSLEHYFDSIA